MRNPCYHCNCKPAVNHSNFCEECLPENRPLYYPQQKATTSPRTRLLLLIAFGSTTWCIFKAIELISK